MSDNAFERTFSKWLDDAGIWYYHPSDERWNRQRKPGDFIYFGGVIECKETAGHTFQLSDWSQTQRNHACWVIAGGGAYWLIVRFSDLDQVIGYRIELPIPERGSFKPEQGTPVWRGGLSVLFE